jgi:tripartite-type tricarboxylate transporter receptor subunit TctC
MQSLRIRRSLLVGVLAAVAGVASAQTAAGGTSDFPSRAVRLVVPFPAGGNSDIIARTLAIKLSQMWNQPVIVDNKPGADTFIGTSDVVRAPADGHTILSNISLIVQNSVTKKLPFDTFKELRPLIAATETSMYFVASAQSDAAPKTLAEFVQQAKARPGTLSFGSFGTGSTGHLLLLTLQRTTSIDVTHVPFKGNADVVIQLINGQVTSSFLPYSAIAPHVAAGKIRILAATGDKRPAITPNVPTFEELGVNGFEASQWNGFFVSAKTPPAIMAKLTRDFDAAIRSPEVAAKLQNLGLSPVGGTPEKFQAMVDKDFDLVRAAIASKQLKLD